MNKALALALVALCALPAAAQAGTWTRENSTPMTFPPNGASTPYPSVINVVDLPGSVTKVTATVQGIGSTAGSEFDIALVGPNGQNVMLMSDRCSGNMFTARDFTFEDGAPQLPDAAPGCAAGTYAPSNFDAGDPFVAPGPGAPHGSTMAALNGGSPNGNWSLFAVDDTGVVASNRIERGWSLKVTTDAPETCAGRQGTIFGTDEGDDLVGTDGDDVIVDFGGRDEIRGLGGADVICGGGGNDKLVGGPGKDRLSGESGSDRLLGGGAKDRLLGGPDKDTLRGGKGKDVLKGGGGKDNERE